MKVLFVSPNTERINMPALPLGLALVAAATRRSGHATRFLDLLTATDALVAVRQSIGEFQPEVIALSIRNVDDQSMQDTKFLLEPVRDIVAACRAASQAKIVVGGAGYSIFPAAALNYLDADYGVCGEGEVVFPLLLERLQRGQNVAGLPGVYVRGAELPTIRTSAEDVDLLPLPGAELWVSASPDDPEVWVPVQTRRGCPLACSYCSTPELEGTQVRMRSLSVVVWKHDPEGFKKRFEKFLSLGAKYGISVMPVLFDDCVFGDPLQFDPYLGKQREPIPGMILPNWTPSPGRKLGNDPAEHSLLEKYVKDMIATFGKDRRVVAWDLYNEPMNVAGVGKRALLKEIITWAGEVRPDQPLTVGLWNANDEINQVLMARSDVSSFHCYGDNTRIWNQIAELKKPGRPLLCTEWMARLLGSRWETDLPLFKAEGVGCYNWGLVNGRTQANFSWRNKRGDPAPSVWFHDLFHADGRPYDPAEHEVIRRTTADKRLDWSAKDFRQVQTHAPGSKPPQMLYGDSTRHGRPFAKDPSVVRFGERHLMHYSTAPSADKSLPKGWAIGIAESHDLVNWKKVGEILPEQECEKNGIVNGRIILLDGLLHLFYNTYIQIVDLESR